MRGDTDGHSDYTSESGQTMAEYAVVLGVITVVVVGALAVISTAAQLGIENITDLAF